MTHKLHRRISSPSAGWSVNKTNHFWSADFLLRCLPYTSMGRQKTHGKIRALNWRHHYGKRVAIMVHYFLEQKCTFLEAFVAENVRHSLRNPELTRTVLHVHILQQRTFLPENFHSCVFLGMSNHFHAAAAGRFLLRRQKIRPKFPSSLSYCGLRRRRRRLQFLAYLICQKHQSVSQLRIERVSKIIHFWR